VVYSVTLFLTKETSYQIDMAVYVDNFYVTGAGQFGRMKMSHLIADTTEELLEMVDKIGVKRIWIQYPGTANEHFDIAMCKRELAIKNGAIQINFREYAQRVNDKAAEYGIPRTHASVTLLKYSKKLKGV
jgi:hypothetical protein